ncbi:polysaccharide deacetylase family protein [Alkalibaculum sp. M08DMB]|uniref:Polysaccharide deacetylase family protein n=1 Tax=Alkalibaculum sporogenes TaxID=2655001 RepID=A0A6A7K735_9FIRM|nr:polysaccharide deacetylase family protein [Alkalibaculum sporogenes]MPW24933.1 polysaccharide deacetylase family protein [Alkalibaculum sporogenes]
MKLKYTYLPFILIFIICMIVISLVNNFLMSSQEISVEINNSDNEQKDWFIQKEENNERPTFPTYVDQYIDKYKIFVVGGKDNEIYLTFNCGYEHNNYTMDILDILKEEDVKAAFFVTGGYLRSNTEIIKRMVEEGHIVANHGNTHADLSKLEIQEIKKEIVDFENSYSEVTGLSFDKKYFRPASGIYTEQVLEIAYDLGYTSVFWSLSYMDWEIDNQPGRDAAYSTIMKYYHDGSIFMLHTVSKSNVEALKDVIVELKSNGYIFKTLDEFPNND